MLSSYIKELENNENPELPRVLVDLYESAVKFDTLIQKAKAGETLKMSALRLSLTSILTDIEDAEAKLKLLRAGAETRELVPQGINNLMRRLMRVTTEIANATIYADKSERISQRELVQIYHDSFPFDDLTTALTVQIEHVRSTRLKARMHTTHQDRDNIVNDGKPYVPPADEKAATALLRKQALLRQQQAGGTNLGKKIAEYSKYNARLPSSLKGQPFKAFHMPIVPDFKDMGLQIDPEKKLKSLGFKVTVLSDAFVILEDQFIIAFDHKQMGIDSGVRKDKSGNFVVVRKTLPKEQLAANEATDKLLELLENINEKSHERYALGSTTFIPNPKNPKLWLAWVVRENQRKGIAKMASTVEAGWGLPMTSIRGNSDDE